MYYDTAILDRVIWVPRDKQLFIRITLGYYQDNGVWRDTSEKQYVIENVEGTPAYDQLFDFFNNATLKDTPIELLITQVYNKGDLLGDIIDIPKKI